MLGGALCCGEREGDLVRMRAARELTSPLSKLLFGHCGWEVALEWGPAFCTPCPHPELCEKPPFGELCGLSLG